MSHSEARTIPNELESLHGLPAFAARFLIEGKRPPAGTMRRDPALAALLEHVAREGLDDFYRGDIAREASAELDQAGVEEYAKAFKKPEDSEA